MAGSVGGSDFLSPLLLLLGLLGALASNVLQVVPVLGSLDFGFVLLGLSLLGGLTALFVLLALRLVLNASEAHILGGLNELVGALSLLLLAFLVAGGLFRRVLALLVGGHDAHSLRGAKLNQLGELVALVVRLEDLAVELCAKIRLGFAGPEACRRWVDSKDQVIKFDCFQIHFTTLLMTHTLNQI